MTRNFEYGKNTKEVAIGRHAMTASDFQHRVEHKKTYPCAKCGNTLTIFEHVKFMCFCRKCAEMGDNHLSVELATGKVWGSN